MAAGCQLLVIGKEARLKTDISPGPLKQRGFLQETLLTENRQPITDNLKR